MHTDVHKHLHTHTYRQVYTRSHTYTLLDTFIFGKKQKKKSVSKDDITFHPREREKKNPLFMTSLSH